MDSKNISKKPERHKKLIWVVAILLIYTVGGFLVVPEVIKSQMLKRLPALTKRSVTVEQVKFNPYALSLTIRGLKLTAPVSARARARSKKRSPSKPSATV